MPRKLQCKITLDLRANQELKGDLAANTTRLQIRFDLQKWMLCQDQIRTSVCHDNQETKCLEFAGYISQQVNRRGVGPVQVIKKEDQRARLRDFLEIGAQFQFQSLLRCRSA